MLETDCIIPRHVPIPHDPVTLYGDARAVRALQREGLGKWAIIKKLRISEETYNDAVYEINKAKAVSEIIEEEEMARGVKLTAETVSRIREMKDNGNTMREIAEECNCGVSTVNHICNGKKSQINEEFDNAVNQMIEEAKEPEPVAMNTAKIPEAVLDAVTAQISHLENIVACNLDEIRTLQRENEEYRTKIANMRTWLAEVDA